MAVRAVGSSREPEEWQQATAKAREARAVVGDQVRELIVAADVTGSRDYATERVRQVGLAARTGDPDLLRAAVVEASVAFGAWAVALDLRQPAR